MGVYFRTSDRSGVGIPWLLYVFVVLPVQAMWLFAKVLVYVFATVAAAAIVVVVFVVSAIRRWRGHEENRPPA